MGTKNISLSEYFASGKSDIPEVIDLRGLEVPEPMERTLLACTQLNPGEEFLAHYPHVPNPLLPHLEARGMAWRVFEEADGSALVLIRKQP